MSGKSDLTFSPRLQRKLGGSRPHGTRLGALSVLIGLIGIGVSLVFGLAAWKSEAPRQLLPDDFTPKGYSPTIPTTDDLHLQKAGLHLLGQFLAVQRSVGPEAKKLAEVCLFDVLDLEKDADRKTRSLIHLMLGDFFLWHEEYLPAIEHLERSRGLASEYPLLVGWRLMLAYEGQISHLLEEAEPWPELEREEKQRELRDLNDKLRRLRDEVRTRIVAHRSTEGTESLALRYRSQPAFFREPSRADGIRVDGMETAFFAPVAGDNPVAFVVDGPEGLDSAAEDGERRALAVGLSVAGPDGMAPLQFAAHDAERVAEGFRKVGYTATVLDSERLTRGAVLRALMLEVLRSRPGDDFVAFFSGHGVVDERGDAGLAVRRARVLAEWLGTFRAPAPGSDLWRTPGGSLFEGFLGDATGAARAADVCGNDGACNLADVDGLVFNLGVGDTDTLVHRATHGVAGPGSLETSEDGGNGIDALTLREIEAVLALHRGNATVLVDSCLTGTNAAGNVTGNFTDNLIDAETGISDDLAFGWGFGPRAWAEAPSTSTNFDQFTVPTLLATQPGGIAVESHRLRAGIFAHALVNYLDLLAAECRHRSPAEDPRRRLYLLDEPDADGNFGETCDVDLDELYRYTAGETARLAKTLHGVVQRPLLIP